MCSGTSLKDDFPVAPIKLADLKACRSVRLPLYNSVMEEGTPLGKIIGSTRNQRTGPLYTVVILSLPTFVAFLIVIAAMLHPNMSVYLLIPLVVAAPACLVIAIVITIAKRHSMGHQISRVAWTVLGLAFLAGMAAIAVVKLT